MTQVDGVETSEQFDFGPFNVHQFALDLDTLKTRRDRAQRRLRRSTAATRSAASSRSSPRIRPTTSAAARFHIGGKTLFDGRADDTSGNVVIAGGRGRVLGVAVRQLRPRPRAAQQGRPSRPRTRRAPRSTRRIAAAAQALGKVVVDARATATCCAARSRSPTRKSRPTPSRRARAGRARRHRHRDDTMQRARVSVDQPIVNRGGLHAVVVERLRAGRATPIRSSTKCGRRRAGVRTSIAQRHARLRAGQLRRHACRAARRSLPRRPRAALHVRRQLQAPPLRHAARPPRRQRGDRRRRAATGLILPSKYFPKSDVGEAGAYVQARDAARPR